MAARIANAKLGPGTVCRFDDGVRIFQSERDRLLDKNRLPGLESLDHRFTVVMLGRGDEHGADTRVGDGRHIVGGDEVGARTLRQHIGLFPAFVGKRQEPDAGMGG